MLRCWAFNWSLSNEVGYVNQNKMEMMEAIKWWKYGMHIPKTYAVWLMKLSAKSSCYDKFGVSFSWETPVVTQICIFNAYYLHKYSMKRCSSVMSTSHNKNTWLHLGHPIEQNPNAYKSIGQIPLDYYNFILIPFMIYDLNFK